MVELTPPAVARIATVPPFAPAVRRPVEESMEAPVAKVRLTIDHVTVGLEAVRGRTAALICRVAFVDTEVAPPAAETVTLLTGVVITMGP